MSNVEKVLNERQKTHGDFAAVAMMSQELKRLLVDNGDMYTPAQRESLDMICTKLARIACGNPRETDHWRDIAGYATLVVKDMGGADD